MKTDLELQLDKYRNRADRLTVLLRRTMGTPIATDSTGTAYLFLKEFEERVNAVLKDIRENP